MQCCRPLAALTLTDAEAEATAAVFRALADPHRVRIVNLLAASGGTTGEGSVCVCELTEPLGLSQPTVSHHLKKLYDAGIVERAQRGRWAFYALRTEALQTLATIAQIDVSPVQHSSTKQGAST